MGLSSPFGLFSLSFAFWLFARGAFLIGANRVLKGFYYRIRGAVSPDQPPAADAFTVSLGELRAASGEAPNPRTDHYQIEVAYTGDVAEVVPREETHISDCADAAQP